MLLRYMHWFFQWDPISFYTQRLQPDLYNFMYSDILTFNIEFSRTKFFNVNNGIPLEKPVNVP